MKLTLEQAVLQKALARVVAIAPRKNTIPILGNLMIDAEGGGVVWLVATDLDREARVRLDARIERGGRTTVPALLFDQIVRNAPSGADVLLELDPAQDPRMMVRFGRSKYHVPVLPADGFPVWKEPAWEAEVKSTAAVLAGLIERGGFAASTEETRQYLLGAYVHVAQDTGRLRFVSTNGHILAQSDGDPLTGEPWEGVIVPTRTLSEFRAAVESRPGDVVLRVSPQGVQLQLADLIITSKVIDGAFPDYVRIVPRDWPREAKVNRRLLADAVTRVNVMTTDKASSIKLSFSPDVITLTVKNDLTGQVVEEVDADYAGDDCEIGFNARYLLGALKQTEADEVILGFDGEASPMRVEPHSDDPEHGEALTVVMPLRL
ncbi:DNA polymerase III subunit beta [Pseudomonas sp. ODNR1LW]|nr:DNA polymerase III subunit beta [Pseudomonas sp. ODNR1LW]